MSGLVLDELLFAYDAQAFEFTLTVPEGGCTAIIGPSGSGKSTLLDLVAGFAKPSSGRLTWNDQDMKQLSPGERPVSMIFQDNNLFPHLGVETNVALGISPSGRLDASGKRAVDDALDAVGLSGYGARMPGELSGGQRQRVALARARVRGRPLLLLDEPMAALGPALRSEMLSQLAALAQDNGTTMVIVTHDPEDARAIADRTAYLDAGRVVLEGPTAEVLKAPQLVDYLGTPRIVPPDASR